MEYNIEEINMENEMNEEINDWLHTMDEEDNELIYSHFVNYNENYTVKDLLLICEYYGFAKEMKSNKFNKEQIINYLIAFENNIENTDIVFRRQNMWFYIEELKTDKFMKKFILW